MQMTTKDSLYIRLSLNKDGNLTKEPWDSSTEKAKSLKLDDFDEFGEVQDIAKLKRTAANRQEAVIILKEIAKKGY